MTIVRNGEKSIKTSQMHHPENLVRMIVVLNNPCPFSRLVKIRNTIWNFYDIRDLKFHDIRDFEFHDIIGY